MKCLRHLPSDGESKVNIFSDDLAAEKETIIACSHGD